MQMMQWKFEYRINEKLIYYLFRILALLLMVINTTVLAIELGSSKKLQPEPGVRNWSFKFPWNRNRGKNTYKPLKEPEPFFHDY